MNGKLLVCFALVAAFAFVEVSGRCCDACGFRDGIDYCPSCNPKPMPAKPTPIVRRIKGGPFTPVKSVCNCHNVHVPPVNIPAPRYIWKHTKPEVCDNRPLIPAPDHMHDFSQEPEELLLEEPLSPCGSRPLYPVDAVSIDLVNKMQQSVQIPEEKLQYGFIKLPQEIPIFKTGINIPEEKLFTVERQIVELKNPRQIVKCGSGCNEEVIVDETQTYPISYLSYKDLGYVPESASDKKFITTCKNTRRIKDVSGERSEECDYKYPVRRCGCTQRKVVSSCDCQ